MSQRLPHLCFDPMLHELSFASTTVLHPLSFSLVGFDGQISLPEYMPTSTLWTRHPTRCWREMLDGSRLCLRRRTSSLLTLRQRIQRAILRRYSLGQVFCLMTLLHR